MTLMSLNIQYLPYMSILTFEADWAVPDGLGELRHFRSAMQYL